MSQERGVSTSVWGLCIVSLASLLKLLSRAAWHYFGHLRKIKIPLNWSHKRTCLLGLPWSLWLVTHIISTVSCSFVVSSAQCKSSWYGVAVFSFSLHWSDLVSPSGSNLLSVAWSFPPASLCFFPTLAVGFLSQCTVLFKASHHNASMIMLRWLTAHRWIKR